MKVFKQPLLKVLPKPSKIKVDYVFKQYDSHFKNLDIKKNTICHEFGELYEFTNILPLELCQKLINITEKEQFKDAPITVGVNKAVMDKSIRSSQRVMFDDFDTAYYLNKLMFQIAPLCSEGAYLLRMNERFRFLKYKEGGTFKKHRDGKFQLNQTCFSMFTLQFYLNDVQKGGGTSFFYNYYDKDQNIQKIQKCVKSEAGKLALFRQNGLLHQGDEVEKGLKYTIRNELMYKYLDNNEIEQIEQNICNVCNQQVQKVPFENCNHSYVKCGCPVFYSLQKNFNKKPQCYICTENSK